MRATKEKVRQEQTEFGNHVTVRAMRLTHQFNNAESFMFFYGNIYYDTSTHSLCLDIERDILKK